MNFLFTLFNHSKAGKSSLDDVIGIVGHQLRALGHAAVRDPTWDDAESGTVRLIGKEEGYNVIVEGFTDPIIEHMAQHYNQGARFICLATEEPTDKGFNHGTQIEMTQRQAKFPEAAKFLDGILHLVPGQAVTRWYSQFAPTAQVELGYAPSLVRAQRVTEPEYDFGFFGSLSPRRHALLKKLANFVGTKKAVRIVMDFADQEKRDLAMQNAKVIVQVRKFDEMGLVSSSRCNTSLNNGRPVIAEPHDKALSKPWDEIVRFTDSESQFLLEARLALRNWRYMHQQQFAAFREKLSPEICIGTPLRSLNLEMLKDAA